MTDIGFILPGESEPLTSEDAQGVLAFLRWGPDMQVVNHEGEHVWLKQVTVGIDSAGHYPTGYITDCCYVGQECERHAPMAAAMAREAPREAEGGAR